MNTTVNGSSCSITLNPTAEKIGKTFAYCFISIVFTGRKFFHYCNSLQDANIKETDQLFYRQYSHAQRAFTSTLVAKANCVSVLRILACQFSFR